MRGLFFLFLLLFFPFVPQTTAWAEGDSDLGKPHVQKPLRYRVDYRIDARYVTLHIVAEPAITGCGSVTDLPMKASFDFESADIVLGDYVFLQPTGTGPRNCGSPYKAASARISIDRGSIARKGIKRFRFWYQHTLDTFLIEETPNGDLSLTPPPRTKMFILGNDMKTLDSRRQKP